MAHGEMDSLHKDETVCIPSDLWNVYLICGIAVFIFIMDIPMSGKTVLTLKQAPGYLAGFLKWRGSGLLYKEGRFLRYQVGRS